MSNTLAIAAVTATLRNLLQTGIAAEGGGIAVTTRPLDKARDFGQADGSGRLNLFLYHTQLNGALRNMDFPRHTRPDETGQPPMALDLFYLMTAYERDEGEPSILGHRLFGRAMRVLHDHPLLGANEIRNALVNNDLHEQIERIRITPQSLSLEEVSKLWTAFQTEYRVSAAYQVSVVLIESSRPSRAPLPVLMRGAGDAGVAVQAGVIPPFPTLLSVQYPNQQPAGLSGQSITLAGHHLGGDSVSVKVESPRLAGPLALAAAGTAEEITFTLPNDPAMMPPGFFQIAAVVARAGEPDRVSNALPLLVAPNITGINPPAAPAGNVTLTIQFTPSARPEQKAFLLLGDKAAAAQPFNAVTGSLAFDFTGLAAGEHFLRLRIDGVDSLLVDRSVTPPQFDPTQKVTIT